LARGTQHRKRRPTAHARAASGTSAVATPQRKHKPPQWQEELFFSRLRVHAKWMFVLLALVFALGFVVFGVGSGSSGISDALQGAFNFGSSGSSISSLEKKAREHPQQAKAWRDLATAYEQKQRTADAVNALQRYIALRPKDQGGLSELAIQQTQLAGSIATDLQNVEIAAQAIVPQCTFTPSGNSPFARMYASPNALQNPIVAAVQANAQSKVDAGRVKLQNAETAAERTYQTLEKLNPKDATTQLNLGQAAQNAGDTPTAIAAYKAFLKLAPSDPLAPQVRQQLQALSPTSAAKSPSG
jgi:tetratricopeptide (TPR) repeat protein